MTKGHLNSTALIISFIILISLFNYSSHAQETDASTSIGITSNEDAAQFPDKVMGDEDTSSTTTGSGSEISGFEGLLNHLQSAIQLDITLIAIVVFVGLLFSVRSVASKLRPDLDIDPRPRNKRRVLIIARPVARTELIEFEKIQVHKRVIPKDTAPSIKIDSIEPPKPVDTRPQIRFICVDGRIRDRMELGTSA